MVFTLLYRCLRVHCLAERCKLCLLNVKTKINVIPERALCKGPNNADNTTIPAAVSGKYKVFKEAESPIILDIEEERRKFQELGENSAKLVHTDEFSGFNLKRGLTGVFDIEEVVDVLRIENVQDIFVATLPQDLKYVDYIVVVTGKSPRHMYATAEFLRKLYKKKCNSKDILPRIEGENSKDWIAMDLGNIAVHIFSRKAREIYDLESLWTVGAAYDHLCNKDEDPLVKLIMQHSIYLGELEPADKKG